MHGTHEADGSAIAVSDKAIARSVILLWLVSMAWLVIEILRGVYTADELMREVYVSATGLWATRFLIASFAISPLLRLTKLTWLGPCRRDLGLIGFVYILVHIVFYVVSVGLFPNYLGVIIRRSYLLAGFAASLCVLPLGLTSTQHSIEVLGRAAWRRVHYLVYPALVLTILHESLYMHDHLPERIAHIALVAVLIGERMVAGLRRARVTVG